MNNEVKNELTPGLITQLICLIILIVLVILSFVYEKVLPFADIMAGLTFFVMAYNKKDSKGTLIISIIFGILFIGLGVFNFING